MLIEMEFDQSHELLEDERRLIKVKESKLEKIFNIQPIKITNKKKGYL
jgi:hypothetical protein